jgi:hypothetical protein
MYILAIIITISVVSVAFSVHTILTNRQTQKRIKRNKEA